MEMGNTRLPLSAGADCIAAFSRRPYAIVAAANKAGKLVQVETVVVSADGKIVRHATRLGIDANGRQINDIAVYDKQ